MIPRRLEITNFLSYRETAELDFTGLHLACISGMNGAGKSSILDAMTWALFGESRGARATTMLVNRVATAEGAEARVVFEFELEEVDYRIIRRKKAGRTMLVELQTAVDTAAGQWKSLTGAKNKETNEAIIQLLGMNFTTFRNASFLLQGQADEFTTKTASQRKQILADLLGVNQWDAYRDAVAGTRKAAENELTILDTQVSDIELGELLQEESRKSGAGGCAGGIQPAERGERDAGVGLATGAQNGRPDYPAEATGAKFAAGAPTRRPTIGRLASDIGQAASGAGAARSTFGQGGSHPTCLCRMANGR